MSSFKSLLFLMLLSASAKAQDSTEVILLKHSPRKATIYSAVLPGAGQIYNKKYWKVPIVYAGLGTCVYFIDRNNLKFNQYKDALIAVNDDDPSTVNLTPYSESQLDELQDTYRSWRDLSWIICAGVYVLQIVDANVDAHLFYFDVGEDISLNLQPSLQYTSHVNTGLSLKLNF
jgi:hypothetical protein